MSFDPLIHSNPSFGAHAAKKVKSPQTPLRANLPDALTHNHTNTLLKNLKIGILEISFLSTFCLHQTQTFRNIISSHFNHHVTVFQVFPNQTAVISIHPMGCFDCYHKCCHNYNAPIS